MAVLIAVSADGSEKLQAGNTHQTCRAANLMGVADNTAKSPT